MATRTDPAAVRATIDADSSISVDPHIRTANVLTDKIAAQDSDSLLDADLLCEIETYLAAHFYAFRDQQFKEEKTGDASAVYQGKTGMHFNSTLWGQTAVALDLTGFLAELSKGRIRRQITWLGLPPSEQTSYEDRD